MHRIVESTRQRQQAGKAADPNQPPASAEVYDEMVQDCRRKAGEATLDRLRKLCQRLSRPDARGEGSEEGLMMSEEETVIVSYHAALLGKAESAANIYGG